MNYGDYNEVYNSLAGQYQPQTDLVNSQIADLPRQEQAVQDSLDQAKVNAFKDITSSANSKGVLFSGVPIDQQATYTGTKYLPAVAQNKTAFLNSKNTLLGQINSLQSARQRQAQDSVSSYQKAQSDNAYKQAQLQLGYARLASSNARGSAGKQPTQAQLMQGDMSTIARALQGKAGKDGHVSQQTWNAAMSAWIGAGYKSQDFVKSNMQFINQRYGGYHGFR